MADWKKVPEITRTQALSMGLLYALRSRQPDPKAYTTFPEPPATPCAGASPFTAGGRGVYPEPLPEK